MDPSSPWGAEVPGDDSVMDLDDVRPEGARPQTAGMGSTSSDASKRRKIRKGTRSCWECKRRKTRCTFSSDADAVCIGCRRRGSKCVSQEFPEEVSQPSDRGRQMGDRIVRVEALIEQLVKKVGTQNGPAAGAAAAAALSDLGIGLPSLTPPNGSGSRSVSNQTTPASAADDAASVPGIPTPESTESESGSRAYGSLQEPAGCCSEFDVSTSHTVSSIGSPNSSYTWQLLSTTNKWEQLSRTLHAALPSEKDAKIIVGVEDQVSFFFHQMLAQPFQELAKNGPVGVKELAILPPPTAHPVLIAKRMLIFATFLQYMHPKYQPDLKNLSEPAKLLQKRLADTAIRLVCTNDELMGTMDSLECVMLEGMYQSNSGNLRRAWLAFRRGMVVGQLMGMHRRKGPPIKVLETSTAYAGIKPDWVWSRIVYIDRFLSLMLGLPQGSTDISMADEKSLRNDHPLGRLERVHSVVICRILERNERDPQCEDDNVTQEIDLELQKVAKSMPPKFWMTPNLNESISSVEMFWRCTELVNQIFHYTLLVQLHLPYMMRFDSDHKYDYSKQMCISAAREALSRFVMFRSTNRIAFCCRAVDFVALMSCMTLLLAHIESHRDERGARLLAHQRLSDRAMMEQALENMDAVNAENDDILSKQSSAMLRRMLAVEADAADGGARYSAETLPVQMMADASDHESNDVVASVNEIGESTHELRICVPYFGTMKITREGVSKEPSLLGLGPEPAPLQQPQQQAQQASIQQQPQPQPRRGRLQSIPTPPERTPSTQYSGDGTPIDRDEAGLPYQQQPQSPPLMAPQFPYMIPPTGLSVYSAGPYGPNTRQQQQQQQTQSPGPDPQQAKQQQQQQQQMDPQFTNQLAETIRQQSELLYPGLTASMDDWAFQGVDLAFFDSLMRGSTGGGSGGGAVSEDHQLMYPM